MNERIAQLREEYETEGLRRDMLDPDPIRQFAQWFEVAFTAGVPQPNTMVVATAAADGRPSARAVLLKGFDERGFVFYTNLESVKGRDLAANPQAGLCLVWLPLHRQVRIEGRTELVSGEEADAYFRSRPYGAQIAAAVSPQSRPIGDREELEAAYAAMEQAHPAPPVPRPATWAGFRVIPDRIEFWQGRQFRLHDRFQYRREGEEWTIERLAP